MYIIRLGLDPQPARRNSVSQGTIGESRWRALPSIDGAFQPPRPCNHCLRRAPGRDDEMTFLLEGGEA